MINIDAREMAASVREFDVQDFVQQLKNWQEEDNRKYVCYILDEVFDLLVDCCVLE